MPPTPSPATGAATGPDIREWIDTPAALANWLAAREDAPWLAVDTEFVRVSTYHPQLCVLQLAGPDAQAAVIDALALAEHLAPVWARLARADTLKVLHAAGQDYEIFVQLAGEAFAPLFDTQVAAQLLNLAAQPISFGGLVQLRLDVTLDKSLSRTDWARRPLSGPQIDYAAADVIYLARLFPALAAELAAAGRRAWLDEDCAREAAYARAAAVAPAAEAWQRLKGFWRLGPVARHAAAKLAEWREDAARRSDRPRGWILPDDALYTLAAALPISQAALERIDEVPPRTARQHGAVLLRMIEQGRALAGKPDAPFASAPPDDLPKGAVAALREVADALAGQHGLPPGSLVNRAGLEAILRAPDAAGTGLGPWRQALAGSALAAAARHLMP